MNDSAWHTATLAGAATVQTCCLDGHLVGSQSGLIQNIDPLDFAGAGVFNTNTWVNARGGTSAIHAGYFTGDLSEIRFWATTQSTG